MLGGRGAMTKPLAKKPSCGSSSPASLEALHLSRDRLLRAEVQDWDVGSLPAGCLSWVCACCHGSRSCSSILSPTTSSCHFPNSLETQPFITGVLYSDHFVSIHIITLPSLGVENSSWYFCREVSTNFLVHSLVCVPNFNQSALF